MSKKKKTFEYKQKYFGAHDMPVYKIAEYLNDEGKKGWELVHLMEKNMINDPNTPANYTFFFKREVV